MEVDLENVCRVCLMDEDPNGVNLVIKEVFIGEVNLVKIMQTILYSVDWENIWEIQGCPSKICPNCLMILQNAYLLNEKCIESEWKLRTLLKDEEIEYLEPEEAEITLKLEKEEVFKRPKAQKASKIQQIEEIHEKKSPKKSPKNSSKNHHVCDICNKNFKDLQRMRDHMITHTTVKAFLCSECGKSFGSKPNLRQHVKIHNNLKEFCCTLCPAQLSSKGALKGHMRSHFGIKPHQCSICGATFTKANSMKKHVRAVHEKIKPYECEYCTMRFATTDHLKRHVRTHTGDRPYVCNFENCTRAYAQSNDLIKHKRVCHNDLLNKCSLCPESFRLLSELRNHYSIVHYSKIEIDDNSMLLVR